MDDLTHDMSDDHRHNYGHIANFDDFFRPIRSYFYWEKHCFDIPVCWAMQIHFRHFDDLDQLSEKFAYLAKDSRCSTPILPQMLAQMLPMISTMPIMRDDDAVHGTARCRRLYNQMDDD